MERINNYMNNYLKPGLRSFKEKNKNKIEITGRRNSSKYVENGSNPTPNLESGFMGVKNSNFGFYDSG